MLELSDLKEFKKEYKPKGLFFGRKKFERELGKHYKKKKLGFFWKIIIFLIIVIGFLFLIGKESIIFDILKYFNLI